MTKEELFDNPTVNEVEEQIASELGLEVYSEQKHIIGNLIQKEIEQSMVGKPVLHSYFIKNRSEFVKFGVLLYTGERKANDGEEYPKGETVPREQRPVELKSHGLGVGFGITYAIYFHFLNTNKLAELSEFLKIRRIPHYKKFQSRIESYYREAVK
jgi:hypothetical protein